MHILAAPAAVPLLTHAISPGMLEFPVTHASSDEVVDVEMVVDVDVELIVDVVVPVFVVVVLVLVVDVLVVTVVVVVVVVVLVVVHVELQVSGHRARAISPSSVGSLQF